MLSPGGSSAYGGAPGANGSPVSVDSPRCVRMRRITAALLRARGEPGLASLYLTNRRAFDRRMERGRQHFFGPPSGAHAAYLRSKGIID